MGGYLRLELLRILRSPGYLISSIAMPLVMYLLFTNIPGMGAQDRHDTVLYTMISMAGFGAVGAAMMNGLSVVQDRANGWLRQLRVTPLSAGRVVVARGIVGMLVSLPSILSVCVLGGLINHVQLPMSHWVEILVLLFAGSAPFAMLGLGVGYLVSVQAAQPIAMVLNFGLSLLGGLWIPAFLFPAFLREISKYTPTSGYAGISRQIALSGHPNVTDVAVLCGWLVAFAALAALAYRRAGRSTAA